jgi:hypothetical protein
LAWGLSSLGYEPNDAHLCRPRVSPVTLLAWADCQPEVVSDPQRLCRSPCLVALRLQICYKLVITGAAGPPGLPVAIAVDVDQVVVDLMSIAADDLHRAEGAELGMFDHGLDWCVAGGVGPLSCRRPQNDQADSR